MSPMAMERTLYSLVGALCSIRISFSSCRMICMFEGPPKLSTLTMHTPSNSTKALSRFVRKGESDGAGRVHQNRPSVATKSRFTKSSNQKADCTTP